MYLLRMPFKIFIVITLKIQSGLNHTSDLLLVLAIEAVEDRDNILGLLFETQVEG
jgi:hypothetical protein